MILIEHFLLFTLVSFLFAALTSFQSFHDGTTQPHHARYTLASPNLLLSLPEEILLIVFTFIPNFPILSEVNHCLLNLYENNRTRIISDRLDGFDPGQNYKMIGTLILNNYENSGEFEIIKQMLKMLKDRRTKDRKLMNLEILTLKYHIQIEFIIFLAIKSLKYSEFLSLKDFYWKFEETVMKALIKEKKLEAFKTIFPHWFQCPSNWETEGIQFIAENREELFPILTEFFEKCEIHQRIRICHTSRSYIMALIIISAPFDDLLSSFDAFEKVDQNTFKLIDLKIYFDNDKFKESRKTQHQKDLFSAAVEFMSKRYDPNITATAIEIPC